MKVKAAKGLRCPMEGDARRYITDSAAIDVPDSAYYRRLLADGSLVPVLPGPESGKKDKGEK